MIALLSLALAAPTPSLGIFAGGHLAGPQHELYAFPAEHDSLAPTLPVGLRAGVHNLAPLFVEGEAFVGPGDGLLYGWRGHLGLKGPSIGRSRLLFVGGYGTLGHNSDALGNDLDMAGHLGPGIELPLNQSLVFRGDVRWLLSAREGEGLPGSHGEALIGIAWQKTTGDTDGDGIADTNDACIRDPETRNNWRDEDGCPDELATAQVVVRDPEGTSLLGVEVHHDGRSIGTSGMDGIRLSNLRPDTPLVLSAVSEGFAPRTLEAALVEGPQEVVLVLPWEPGTVRATAKSNAGAALTATVVARGPSEATWTLTDGEHQGVLEPGDYVLEATLDGYEPATMRLAVSDVPGPRAQAAFTLSPTKVRVEERSIVTLDTIRFEYDKAQLTAGSLPIVRAVAHSLKAAPHILLVEVGGHASDEGTASYNQQLSQQRVNEVVRQLVAQGVEASRLVAKGYGESKPLSGDPAANRRVEFTILKESSAAEGAP